MLSKNNVDLYLMNRTASNHVTSSNGRSWMKSTLAGSYQAHTSHMHVGVLMVSS